MKEKKSYSNLFKRNVAKVYLTSDKSLHQVGKEFNVSHSAVCAWAQKYKAEFCSESQLSQEITTFGSVINTKTPMKEKKLTPEQMAERIAELEQKLKHEMMHRTVLDTMIDIAERDLNIAIRKKSGAKQSK